MDKKALQRVTGRFMQDLYEQQQNRKWTDDGLLFIRRVGEHSSQVFSSGVPFQLEQLHIGVVMKGEQDVIVNMRHLHLTAGTMLIASPESIMQQEKRTEDFDMQTIHVGDDLLQAVFGGTVPPLFGHRMSDRLLLLDEQTLTLLLSMLDTLWLVLGTDYHKSSQHQLAAILHMIDLFSQHEEEDAENRQPRNVAIFNRFLSLVAEHCDRQRTLDFYAGELCLSKQYLGSIIGEVSHRSAREWIEEATLTRIKVLLKHSTASLADISEKMSFAEPSHFSRYFKRLTGLTPNAYRNQDS